MFSLTATLSDSVYSTLFGVWVDNRSPYWQRRSVTSFVSPFTFVHRSWHSATSFIVASHGALLPPSTEQRISGIALFLPLPSVIRVPILPPPLSSTTMVFFIPSHSSIVLRTLCYCLRLRSALLVALPCRLRLRFSSFRCHLFLCPPQRYVY